MIQHSKAVLGVGARTTNLEGGASAGPDSSCLSSTVSHVLHTFNLVLADSEDSRKQCYRSLQCTDLGGIAAKELCGTVSSLSRTPKPPNIPETSIGTLINEAESELRFLRQIPAACLPASACINQARQSILVPCLEAR